MAIIVTGASSGFGKAICKIFVENGYKTIGCSRRIDKLEQLKEDLGDNFIHLRMDLNNRENIQQNLNEIQEHLPNIELLVNNAGLALGLESAEDANFDDWMTMINTNIIGLSFLTRQIIPHMVANQKGHIINIGSVAAEYPYPGGNVYGATKAYVKQFSKNLRADLAQKNIRVSLIEPGISGNTEFSQVRFKGNLEKAKGVYENVNFLKSEDIANIVFWIFKQPEHVNLNLIEVMPVCQTYSALTIHKNK